MRQVEDKIKKLKQAAMKQGLLVRFRNVRTNMGDFCIFIYDKAVRASYMVGFDGDWFSDYLSFEDCLNSAYKWLENRDKRYMKIDGKWVYVG